MADPQSTGEFINRYHGRVAPALFEAADVLLTEAGYVCQLFLRQAFLQPNPQDVPAHQLAHVHAAEVSGLPTRSLSTIVCTRVDWKW